MLGWVVCLTGVSVSTLYHVSQAPDNRSQITEEHGVMPGTSKQQVIESLLGNESLTDGLPDDQAQRILQWCIGKIEASTLREAGALAEYGQRLALQARTVSRLAQQLLEGIEASRIQPRLQRLTQDASRQQQFLAFLRQKRSLAEYIDALLRLAEGD